MFEIFKSLGVRVVFTAHEFIAICHQYGQMLKTNGRLCHQASPAECGSCFSDIAPGQFFLRERLMKLHLGYADCIVSPSAFLARRLIEWGLPQDRVTVIENPISPGMLARIGSIPSVRREAGSGAAPRRVRLGYFGQLNPFKGIDVLLRALQSLPEEVRETIDLAVYGANLERQKPEFQTAVTQLLHELKDCVTFMGPYENDQARELMRRCDWIVMPSIWWENSPVVIQEAALAGRPVLCSRLGGMAEKVRDGETGLHFEAGSVVDLAGRIAEIAEGRTIAVDAVAEAARHPRAAWEHSSLYQELIAGSDAQAVPSPEPRAASGRASRRSKLAAA